MPYKLKPPGGRGPCWYVRGSDASGPFEYSTGKDNRRAAEKWVEEVFLPDRARRRVPGKGESVGFAAAAKFYKAATPHLSKADIRAIDALAAEIGDLDCRSVGHVNLVAAANTLKAGLSDSTKNRSVMSPGAAVLHYAADQEWCDYKRLPKFWVSRKSPRSPVKQEDMARLLAHLADPIEELAPQWVAKGGVDPNLAHKKILLMLLFELGLRLSDNLRIGWTEIDLQAAKVQVRIGKTDDMASLEISAAIVAELANLPEDRKRGRLFPWSTSRGVYAWLDRVKERAKVHYTPHLSRHALATAADEAQIPDKRAAELGMWADQRSLHRYQHVRPTPIPGRTAALLLKGSEETPATAPPEAGNEAQAGGTGRPGRRSA